jgi:hypothetical protein
MREEMNRCCEAMEGWSCKSMLKKHRRAIWTAFFEMALMLLVLQAGWVLGVVAFFRTL